jgi:hypothetical protein
MRLGEAGRARASHLGLEKEIEGYWRLYDGLAPACP